MEVFEFLNGNVHLHTFMLIQIYKCFLNKQTFFISLNNFKKYRYEM